jgi:hypothetical protein
MPNSRNPPAWWEDRRITALEELHSLTKDQMRDTLERALRQPNEIQSLTVLIGAIGGHSEWNQDSTKQGATAGEREAARRVNEWAESRLDRPAIGDGYKVARQVWQFYYGERVHGYETWRSGFVRAYVNYLERHLPQ